MTKCLFCNFPQHKRIYEDSIVYVIKDEFPVTIRTSTIPKEHIATWFDASFELQTHLMKILSLMKKEIPRYFGDSKNPKEGIRGVIPEK
ncbi:MAG: hypothetical protein GWP59_05340 [Chlamydiales bacterium]|nr:hypothetical protein [Chlamydiales bacterium]